MVSTPQPTKYVVRFWHSFFCQGNGERPPYRYDHLAVMWPVRPTHRSLSAAQVSILPSGFLAHVELLSASLARFIAVIY